MTLIATHGDGRKLTNLTLSNLAAFFTHLLHDLPR